MVDLDGVHISPSPRRAYRLPTVVGWNAAATTKATATSGRKTKSTIGNANTVIAAG
jgi:hypothetical protein